MKEAAGEANMTVITIVLIAIVLAVGTVVVNTVMSNTKRNACCQSIGGKVSGQTCIWTNVSGKQTSVTMNKTFLEKYCPEE